MSSLLGSFATLLAADPATAESRRAIEFDWPGSGWQTGLFVAGLVILVLFSVFTYLRDTRTLNVFWRIWLMGLRLAVFAALAIIALNPQERTRKLSFRPSRVAILADTSLSMRFPAEAPPEGASAPAVADSETRAQALAKLLSQSPLIETLRQDHEISLYTFDSALLGPAYVWPSEGQPSVPAPRTPIGEAAPIPAPPDWDALLEPRGLETRLGEGLHNLLREAGGRTLSGIVVFSDGVSNAGIEAVSANEAARNAGIRLNTVGLGSTTPSVNLQLANFQSPTDVHIGDPFEIMAYVQGRGFAGQPVHVDLLVRPADAAEAEPTLIESRDVTVAEDGVPVEVKFPQDAAVAGRFDYSLRVKPGRVLHELSIDDNEVHKTIQVVDRETRVLLFAGGPTREYQFLRNALYRHSTVAVDVLLQTVVPESIGAVSQESKNLLAKFPETAAELDAYDCIVAFDPDWSLLTPEQRQVLNRWVSEQAGGLIFVAGEVNTPALAEMDDTASPVRDLLPVFLNSFLVDVTVDSTADQPWPVGLTREGTDAGFMQLSDDPVASQNAWKAFPGMFRAFPSAGTKAGATVLARFTDPRAVSEHGAPVLVASQFYGSGRTVYLGSGEMWRLRFLSDDYYDRFWTKAIRDVSQGRLRRGNARGFILLERDHYVLGQTVRVRAALRDAALAPLSVESVTMDVYDPKGRPILPARKLSPDEVRPGQYVGDFRAGLPGVWQIEVRYPDSNEKFVERVDVVLPNLEFDRPEQNARLLSDLTRDTGGAYLTMSEAAAKLPELLPNRSEQFLVDEQLRTLWDRAWVLLALVGLLSAEWLTRKLLRMA